MSEAQSFDIAIIGAGALQRSGGAAALEPAGRREAAEGLPRRRDVGAP